ncbi:MAG: terpene cyclase/mutase family protein, partial [Planctomycetota bacterium]|nr:terpene cyclase/mutase family protein [Planctomycetota bacterium]
EPEDPEPLASVSDIASESPPPLESLNPLTHEMSPLSDVGVSTSQLVEDPGNGMNVSGLSGREGAARASLLESGGGTPGTEQAVQRALQWLANHQHENGSWDFDTACDCPNAGHLTGETVSATALALLPFLGAGNTHEEGEYREVVKRGLYFLRQQQDSQGSFLEPEGGKMYAHALASIALCEAYAMSQDRGLRSAAQQSLDFISIARDPRGGGWRYIIGEPGDTSVTGWVIMALKSGRMGYLSIPDETVQGAKTFLDSMQTEGGSTYGYDRPGDAAATSAVGLLCRMYMGWSRDHQGLHRGVELLARHGPSKDDIYYDYYATQVMRHYGGSSWEKWNQRMRGILVNSQQRTGHTAGSWFFPADKGAVAGGRLYSTAMATMILEVYYRHLPIYGENAAGDHFPL